MAKSQNAVVLTRIDGELRQLFKIEERAATGDLTIVLKKGLKAETVDGQDKGEVERRYISIHRSQNSTTHNIVHTEISGGVNRRYYAQFSPNKSYGYGIIWPVYAFRATNLPEEAYNPKVRPSDRAINLGNLHSSQWSLAVMIVVREFSMQLPKHWAFNHIPVLFSHFWIDILWTYIKVPTTTLGDYLIFATKQEMVDGQIQAGLDIIDAKCPAPYRLSERQDQALSYLGSNALRKIARLARKAGAIISDELEEEMANRPFLLSGTMNDS